ncbi:MAG: 6-bladed beta-propeller [Nitrospirota bacterium]
MKNNFTSIERPLYRDCIRCLPIFVVIIAAFTSVIGCGAIGSRPSDNFTGEYVWPAPPETPRIKWLRNWMNRYDFGKPNQVLTFLMGEDPIERLRRPQGVVADAAGNVYVADSEQHGVFVFDQEKNVLRFLGEGILGTPVGLAIDNKLGIIYVADSKLDKVVGFDKNTGKVVLNLGVPGEFKNPSGLVFDEERERLFVADTKNNVIRVFDKNGKELFTIGKKGEDDGEFSLPSFLALDRQGRLYVVDTFNFRVQIFDQNGRFLRKFGRLGDASGRFSRPAGIGVDSDEHIYVVDTAFSNFQIFDIEGKLLLWVGSNGMKPGEFGFPVGMYIDRTDKIYVADAFNRRVQVFQYLKESKENK